MPKEMGYGDSGKNSGKDSAAKKGGSDLSMGLSSRAGMGDYAKGDAKGDYMPKGGSAPDVKVKKAGKSFTMC